MDFLARVFQPSTLRILVWPDASSAQNNMAAVSADGSTVCVLILRLNSSCSRSIAFVVRALRHWLGGSSPRRLRHLQFPPTQRRDHRLAKMGLTTPPCGVPRVLPTRVPSSSFIGAVSHLSIYSKAHSHFTCLRTARSNSVWSMLSNRPRISNSSTQSYFQHRSRVTPMASSADLLGR